MTRPRRECHAGAPAVCEEVHSLDERHHLAEIEFLHVDTEGHDLQVLQSVDLQAIAPHVIWVEYKHLSPSDQLVLQSLLEFHGYDVRQANDDYLAVHRDFQNMMHRNRRSDAL